MWWKSSVDGGGGASLVDGDMSTDIMNPRCFICLVPVQQLSDDSERNGSSEREGGGGTLSPCMNQVSPDETAAITLPVNSMF